MVEETKKGKKSITALIIILCVFLIAAIVAAVLVVGSNPNKPIGGDTDEHSCLVSAGYSWDSYVGACLRSWELNHDQKRAARTAVHHYQGRDDLTVLNVQTPVACLDCHFVELKGNSDAFKLTIGDCAPKCFNQVTQEVLNAAHNSECTEKGTLSGEWIHNKNSNTWWIDIDMKPRFEKPLCNPACVINEETLEVEINWRCTGLLS